MTTAANDIKTEIRELIDLQIQVFGQPAPLTPFELEDCRRRAERIKSLGKELDQVGIAAIQQEVWRRAGSGIPREELGSLACGTQAQPIFRRR